MQDLDQPPKSKGGRPKGSKNRPKWVIPPKHKTRGRPKGSKNKPKTLEAYIATAFEPIKPREPTPPGHNKGKKFWTPEQAKERMAKARAGIKNNNTRLGVSAQVSKKEHDRAVYEAEQLTKRIMKYMAEENLLPDDAIAQEAIKAALVILRTPSSTRDKISIINTILNFTKQKPATKTDLTVKTAEDFLDEISDTDGSGS